MVAPDELKYWVGFSRIPGIGRVRFSQLKEHFGNLQDAWKASESELKQTGLDSRRIEALLLLRPKISLDAETEKLESHKVKTLVC